MRRKLNLLFILFLVIHAYGQKPILTPSNFKHWPYVNSPSISADGKYIVYRISETNWGTDTLYIQSVNQKWKDVIPNIKSYIMAERSNKIIMLTSDKKLKIKSFEKRDINSISDVQNHLLFSNDRTEWLLYQTETKNKELTLRDIKTNKEIKFINVSSYTINQNNGTIILKKEEENQDVLYWLDIKDFKEQRLFSGKNISNIVMDEPGNQIIFSSEEENNKKDKIIWYYKRNDKKVSRLISEHQLLEEGLEIADIQRFSHDGTSIFLNLKEIKKNEIKKNPILVDIWSSRDSRLQELQLQDLSPRTYLSVMNIEEKHIIRLQKEFETINFLNNENDNIATARLRESTISEQNWNPAAKLHNFILNCRTGQREEINLYLISISPDSKYLIGLDETLTDLCSYEISSGKVITLTKDLPIPTEATGDTPENIRRSISFAGWNLNDGSIIFYDDYDIWKIDPKKQTKFTNLTNGYGRKHSLVFRLGNAGQDKNYTNENVKLLSTFNTLTKENGFFEMSLSGNSDPTELTLDSYYYSQPDYMNLSARYPIKAKNKNIWIVTREKANVSPNYFITTDFKYFNPITNLQPENKFNWFTYELINYTSQDGKETQGVLFKPENLDPSKKYPVIINYYEILTDQANVYREPDLIHNNVNIPLCASNGYTIFTPDVHYTITKPGESVLNSVLGGAKLLSSYSWIDSIHIGIQGHSFGGYETNYIITHTPFFAAAISSSGFCNLVSIIGNVPPSGDPYFPEWAEEGQGRIGYTLWQRPDLYIENSPIFNADKVTTPVLLMNNKQDYTVPFTQGVEFFTALRRLNKVCWMLQYDGEKHSLTREEYALDYTLRYLQFFDHYLKGKPMPQWMKSGIPAKLKGVERGY
ncbi:Dipeptidyl aminopeptidase/acylaminoacyl peptidase [Chitinophaga sp. CF118]|uniref:alpha/beta hydrolase family protein n=1 Tax=Chitinophaga sp. CF118 TaxID=1884367 RepID=UPI0008EB38DC|nr:prolyl oligopeptidase family serine peptidase [Chitinophaga sp. CF118]SFE44896.1 Dipeptidyl aminopeptidase/acylaminoacyl peptidase [Chitinophaga sp. CF118]